MLFGHDPKFSAIWLLHSYIKQTAYVSRLYSTACRPQTHDLGNTMSSHPPVEKSAVMASCTFAPIRLEMLKEQPNIATYACYIHLGVPFLSYDSGKSQLLIKLSHRQPVQNYNRAWFLDGKHFNKSGPLKNFCLMKKGLGVDRGKRWRNSHGNKVEKQSEKEKRKLLKKRFRGEIKE